MWERFQWQYRIESSRYGNHDYTDGWYYVTIVVKGREEIFGNVIDEKMVLNDIGMIVENEIQNISQFRDNVLIDEYVVMPNHVHMIVVIEPHPSVETRLIASLRGWNKQKWWITWNKNPMGKWNLGEIVSYLKWKCTYLIHNQIDTYFQWQPNYHDRIIRDENELNQTRQYIQNNPYDWSLGVDKNDW